MLTAIKKPTYLPINLSWHLPTYLSTYLSFYLPIFLPTYISTYVPTFLPSYLPTYLYIFIPTCLSFSLQPILKQISKEMSQCMSIVLNSPIPQGPIKLNTYCHCRRSQCSQNFDTLSECSP